MKQLEVIELERIDVSKMTLLELYGKFKEKSWEHLEFKVEEKKVFLVSNLVVYKNE